MVRWEGGLGLYTDYMQRPYLGVHGAQEEPRSEGLSGGGGWEPGSKCGVAVPIPSGGGKRISPYAFIKLLGIPGLVLAALGETGVEDKP